MSLLHHLRTGKVDEEEHSRLGATVVYVSLSATRQDNATQHNTRQGNTHCSGRESQKRVHKKHTLFIEKLDRAVKDRAGEKPHQNADRVTAVVVVGCRSFLLNIIEVAGAHETKNTTPPQNLRGELQHQNNPNPKNEDRTCCREMMKTLWERLEPWFIPVAAVTRFLAPAAITAISC